MPGGTGSAQRRQRGCGCAKRSTQASQTGCAGQVWHTAHWLGMCCGRPWSSWRNMESIYSPGPSPVNHVHRSPTHPGPRCRRALGPDGADGHRPGCMRRWRGAWKSGCSGSSAAPRRGPTGSLLQGGLAVHAALVQRYPAAQCLVVEPEPARRAIGGRGRWRSPGGGPPAGRGPGLRFHPPPDGTQVDWLWANMALHMSRPIPRRCCGAGTRPWHPTAS